MAQRTAPALSACVDPAGVFRTAPFGQPGGTVVTLFSSAQAQQPVGRTPQTEYAAMQVQPFTHMLLLLHIRMLRAFSARLLILLPVYLTCPRE
jgi:hypothetical protein